MVPFILRLVIAIVVAVVASGLFAGYLNPAESTPYVFDLRYVVAFLVATISTALVSGCIGSSCASQPDAARNSHGGSHSSSGKANDKPASRPAASKPDAAPAGPREQGTVKWFNVSKGFGFITRENGEDIFVHYRNIRGEGRRRLFDGQLVEFCVTTGDKGLQADDIEILKN